MTKKIVTLTNQQLIDGKAGLDILASQKMAIVPGFSVAKNKAAIAPHAKDYLDYRNQILKRHAQADSRGNVAISNGLVLFETPEAEAAAKSELDELGAIEVTVEIRTLALASLGDMAVEPNVLGALEWMFEEEEARE